ncbi:hypothetical protein ACFZB9_23790 [Kitasatospora sp. NPDC008050]|uniref:hypothetical protein n=1 Tax=Kitasatospora sp. NPDC008050 TaxID=3364021 RepID=UPI0036E80FC1
MPNRRTAALPVLGALLDRSLAQIAEAAADARTYDRETIRAVSDVWDNNTFPLFRAATARTAWGRERRARAALAWMAEFGTKRRSWVVEQAAAAGHAVEAVLPPQLPKPHHSRDYRGVVMPTMEPVTAEFVRGLAVDYDLAMARVVSLLVERAGRELTGYLDLTVERRYPTEREAAPPAELRWWLADVSAVEFDSRDAGGITVGTGPDGVVIGLGGSGSLRAAEATCYLDDRCWELSAAGRAADARTPPRRPDSDRRAEDRRPRGEVGGAARVAASVLRHAMLEIRGVRYGGWADRRPVAALCEVFAGAGEAVLGAGARRGAARREAAFRELVEGWVRRSGSVHAPWLAQVVDEGCSDVYPATKAWAASLSYPSPPPAPAARPWPGGQLPPVELRLARYTAPHLQYGEPQEASALLHFALPPRPAEDPAGPWRLRAMKLGAPDSFRLDTAAFAGPDTLELTRAPDRISAVSQHADALAVVVASAPA